MRKLLPIVCLLALSTGLLAKDYTIASPNGELKMVISVEDSTRYKLWVKDRLVMKDSHISMTLADGTVLGVASSIRKDTRGSRTESINAPFYRQSAFNSSYNYLSLRYEGNYTLQVRAYNDGMAYRFVTSFPDEIEVLSEEVHFNFADAYQTYIPWKTDSTDPFESSFENQYSAQLLGQVGDNRGRLAFLPILVKTDSGANLLLTESDVEDYPGMFVKLAGQGFRAVFPPVPEQTKASSRGVERPVSYSNIIARTSGSRSFPWRIIAYAPTDKDLPVNNMVYQTASPSRVDDTDWISPGKAAWDWWNNNVLYNVPFKAGINTDTYKYHIDFASANSLEYVVIDEGWYKDLDPFKLSDAVDVSYLCGYAQESNVKLLLWISSSLFYNNAEELCEYYSSLGIGGFKIDFFDAQDQKTVQQIYEMAEVAAKYKMVLDLHGMYKPTGLNRTFPNILNFEGVMGMEQLKWSTVEQFDMPQYDVLVPFIRMSAGPMDYTPGAMRNATKEEFRPVYGRPMSQGTRAHQIALYICYDSPLTMLCDSPSDYLRDMPTTEFICNIPTVFTTTRILAAELGKYIITLRERDGVYYIGAITNWEARDIEIKLDFLPQGKWSASIYKDGVNADVTASDYVLVQDDNITSAGSLNIHLAPGGGCAIIIER